MISLNFGNSSEDITQNLNSPFKDSHLQNAREQRNDSEYQVMTSCAPVSTNDILTP